MKIPENRTTDHKPHTFPESHLLNTNEKEHSLHLEDNRSVSASQLKLQEMVDKKSMLPASLSLAAAWKPGGAGSSHPVMQQRADPTVAPDVTRVIEKGIANHGIYLFQEGPETAAVKFSKEDTRRAAFADKVLAVAGVTNPNAAIAGAGEKAAIINNLRSIAERYLATGDDQQKLIGAKINEKIGLAAGAKSVLIMDSVGGEEFWDLLKDDRADRSFLNSVTFHRQLGRLTAADALLGNSDRVAAFQRPKTSWAIIKGDNFKVLANGQINTIDNDTELAGIKLLRHLGKITTPEEWARFLIGGGDEHIEDKPGEQPTERTTAGLETLFDPAKRKIIYDELVNTTNKELTVDFDTFDQNFSAGIQVALIAFGQQMNNLLAAARNIGQGDAGKGLIDPDALEHKVRYLRERQGGQSPEDATSRMIFRMKIKEITSFNDDFVKVPVVYTEESGLTKVDRTFTRKDSTEKLAKALKKQSRRGNLDAATLKQQEEALTAHDLQARGQNEEPDRRVFKALFEAKRARLLIYLQETNRALTQLYGGRPSPQWKKDWLQEIDFSNTIKHNYETGIDTWKYKLQRLNKPKKSIELQKYVDSLVITANEMQSRQ
jgi:hypothetical protein